jgi:hypothetical protein
MKVRCEIKCYEVNGREHPLGTDPAAIAVESHGTHGSMVVLRVSDQTYTVAAEQLIGAVQRAKMIYSER